MSSGQHLRPKFERSILQLDSSSHHTGHRIGAAWSEEPRITPYCEERIDEGMVLALEPYREHWHIQDLVHVGTRGPELLSDKFSIEELFTIE